jgi:chemotaxis protein methyltransferase CheR
MVSFEQHDLISGRSKSGYDLVLCRNLLIYIDKSYKEPIFETLTEAVAEGGFLTIGKSETLPRAFRDAYEPYDRSKHIYRRC